jgi:transcriptional regulator with XRE-family HTH domain
MSNVTFGSYIREKREEQRVSLRQFCNELNIDPSRWSKVERGILQPPSDDETLNTMAKLLAIKKNSPDWAKLKDLAVLGRGEIPKDIMEDEELVACLPMVFRTLRREKPSKDQLLSLADLIRHSNKGDDVDE